MQIQVPDEELRPLRLVALANGADDVREEASRLFVLKLHEEVDRLQLQSLLLDRADDASSLESVA